MSTMMDAFRERAMSSPLQLAALAGSSSNSEEVLYNWSRMVQPAVPPSPSPICGNLSPGAGCYKPGTKVCSGCRLVSYCSKECQAVDWKQHKSECRDPLLSPEWKPVWRAQGYKPTFNTDDSAGRRNFRLWSDAPPVDIVRLKSNENDLARGLNIAFVDSGDLRNIVETVNSLPAEYKGSIEMIINDPDAAVSTRNLALLLLLGSHPDDILAVDASVHVWLSAFMPHPYFAMHRGCFYPLRSGSPSAPLGNVKSKVGMVLLDEPNHLPEWFTAHKRCFDHVGEPGVMENIETVPARKRGCQRTPDDLDRLYAQLAPPHRLSFKRFQVMGLALPFIAERVHFLTPNKYFFSPSKTWTPPPIANPLDGWDIGKVIAAGITHGAQSEDIYGCLYYYLTDQLKEFRRRIRSKITVTFRVMALPAAELCATIRRQRPSMRFDRIDLGCTVDHDKAGLQSAMQMWAPLLAAQRDAAITGLCRAWTDVQPNGKAKGAGDGAVREALRAVVENMKSQKPVDTILSGIGSNEGLFFSVCHNVEMGYDNSKAFASYLEKQGLKEVESRSGLKLRDTHRIVPHRIGVPVDGPGSALPEFENEEAWYHATMLNSISWSDRYIEFGREVHASEKN